MLAKLQTRLFLLRVAVVSSSNEEMHLAALRCPALFFGNFTVYFINYSSYGLWKQMGYCSKDGVSNKSATSGSMKFQFYLNTVNVIIYREVSLGAVV